MFKNTKLNSEPKYQKLDIDYKGISLVLDSLRYLHGKIDQKLLEECIKDVIKPKGFIIGIGKKENKGVGEWG